MSFRSLRSTRHYLFNTAPDARLFRYTAGEAITCRKLKLVRGHVQEGVTEEIEALFKCITGVGKRLESIEIVLDGHNAHDVCSHVRCVVNSRCAASDVRSEVH